MFDLTYFLFVICYRELVVRWLIYFLFIQVIIQSTCLSISLELVYGGNANSATIEDLLPDRMYNVNVAALLSQDYELSPIGPVTVKTGLDDFQI